MLFRSVLRAGEQKALLEDTLTAVLSDLPVGLEALPADTHWTAEGLDLGSSDLVPLKPARVAVLYGEPTSSLSRGWIASLLESKYCWPVERLTQVRAGLLGEADFREYDVLVLPDGRGYEQRFGDRLDKWLAGWVSAGGTLVALGRACVWVAREAAGLTTFRVVKDLEAWATSPTETEKQEPSPIPPQRRPKAVPGVFLNGDLDPYHPLTYGCYQACFDDPAAEGARQPQGESITNLPRLPAALFYESETVLTPPVEATQPPRWRRGMNCCSAACCGSG